MQNIIVVIVVIAAAIYVGWTYYQKYKIGKAGANSCGGACAGCNTEATCSLPEKGIDADAHPSQRNSA